jgi:hypothetical protein
MSGFCHCEDCRRASGAGHSAHLLVPETSVTVTGEVKGYQSAADSGNIVERFFCPTCGAAVFSRNPRAMPGMIALRASSLNDLEVFKPQMHVYVGRAASWDARDADLPTFEKMPPGM